MYHTRTANLAAFLMTLNDQQLPSKGHQDQESGRFWKIQEILYLIGTEIIPIGPFKAEKIRFKDFNLHFKIM